MKDNLWDDTMCWDCMCRVCTNPNCSNCKECEKAKNYIPYGCDKWLNEDVEND